MAWENIPYDVVNFTLAGLYYALYFFALVLYFNLFRRIPHGVIFIITFETGVFVRAAYFALQPFVIEDELHILSPINFLVNTIPSFFLFSTGEIYMRSYDRGTYDLVMRNAIKPHKARWFVLVINVLMYICVGALYVADMVLEDHAETYNSNSPQTNCEVAVIIFSSCMYVVSTFSFFVYGYLIYYNSFYFRIGLTRSPHQKFMLRRVGLLGIICSLCFILRAIVTILQLKLVYIPSSAWIVFLYYFFLELVPLTLMIFVLIAVTEPKQNRPNITDLSPKAPLIT